MADVGYSGTPLIKKLGIKPGFSIKIYQAPDHYFELLGPLPDNVLVQKIADKAPSDFIHIFATEERTLERYLKEAKTSLQKDGLVWVSWPKGTSKIPSNINREDVRRVGLAAGLVDVKVAAVDEDWSGLKFVYRLDHR